MRIFSLIIFLLLFTFNTFPQKKLSIKDAVSIALQRNVNIQKTVNNLNILEGNVTSAYGNFLPSVGASSGWNWSRTDDEGGSFNFMGFNIEQPATTTESRSYSASLSSNWNLFDGLANYATLSRAKNNLESARYQLEKGKQDLVFQTISFYYDIINAHQLLILNESNVKWNKKNLETITERNKLGASTLADVYAQQVKLGNAELEFIRAQNNLEKSKSSLLYFLGLDVLDNYTFEEENISAEDILIEKGFDASSTDINQLVEQALTNRPDVKSAKLDLETAKLGITLARSGHYPSLRNSISYNMRANEINKVLDNRTLSVGLTLDIPIFNGWNVSNRVQTAEVEQKNKELDLDDLTRLIKRNLQQVYLDYQAAEKRLEVSKKNVIASEENRKIEEEKYSLGAGTLLNVLIANADYTNAQTSYINAQFDLLKLKEQLEYFLGVLDYKKYE